MVWNYDGCGPNEKDRQLLVEYDIVVAEVNLLLPEYKSIIINIAQKMETGMTDYAHKAGTTGTIYLSTISEYDLYCHYVAGLVSEGLSRIFSASQKEVPWLGAQLQLSNSMGLLQKTNIICDFREDVDQQRFFWPCEIWGKEEYGFKKMKELYEPEVLERATWAQSGMVLDALRHACDSLDYLRILKNQSVFNFCAIPATMAIAMLELCFMNPAMFQRNIKIRKATAASLIMRSVNPKEVGLIFRDYARKIHTKAVTSDPNFLPISIACGKIEQWLEHNYPSFIHITSLQGDTKVTLDPHDPRTRIITLEKAFDAQLANKKRIEDLRNGLQLPPAWREEVEMTSTVEVVGYVMAAFAAIVMFSFTVVYFI